MKRDRVLLIAGALLCAAVILPTIFLRPGRTDLHILLDAARRLWEGRPVYLLSDPNEHTKPPLATLLCLPFLLFNPNLLSRLWDGVNVALYPLIAVVMARSLRSRAGAGKLVLLGILWTLGNWNQEIRLGQYNVITMAMLLAAALYVRGYGSGALTVAALLFKPTNVLFLPWVWRHARSRRALVGGAIGFLALLSVLYCVLFGATAFFEANREWLAFLPLSSAKHLHRLDNFALARIFAESGKAGWMPWVWGLVGLAVVLAAFTTERWLTGLAVAGIASLLLSPMAWFQNFTLCLPFVLLLWQRRLASSPGWRRSILTLALAVFYGGVQLYNPTLQSAGWWGSFRYAPIPLWALLGASMLTLLGLALEKRQPLELKATGASY